MKLTKRLYATVAAVAAGFIAGHLVKLVWRAVSGHDAPEDADDMSLSTIQVTAFAAVVAAATAIAQTLASRKALTALHRGEAKDLVAGPPL
ncbi:MAG: DUF4235 domain-containing protein [Bifidobacteriaceae bacterium]|jgi:hypothetical protein|nr:DUF4235 domain-containing protein [Bifidobacteriaceae bacterium]